MDYAPTAIPKEIWENGKKVVYYAYDVLHLPSDHLMIPKCMDPLILSQHQAWLYSRWLHQNFPFFSNVEEWLAIREHSELRLAAITFLGTFRD
jgi:hypothetical protein